MLKQQYYATLDPKPMWPMQMKRIDAIYGTVKRTIREASDGDKANLKHRLMATAHDFDANCQQVTHSQSDFDQWFDHQIEILQYVPFRWRDAGQRQRSNITFGLAQKYVNLMLKDWWCMSSAASALDCSVLHAPFDRIMWNKLWALTKVDFPSLKQGGYYVYLSRSDYDKYQQHLLDARLREIMKITQPMTRIEIEQTLWGSG